MERSTKTMVILAVFFFCAATSAVAVRDIMKNKPTEMAAAAAAQQPWGFSIPANGFFGGFPGVIGGGGSFRIPGFTGTGGLGGPAFGGGGLVPGFLGTGSAFGGVPYGGDVPVIPGIGSGHVGDGAAAAADGGTSP